MTTVHKYFSVRYRNNSITYRLSVYNRCYNLVLVFIQLVMQRDIVATRCTAFMGLTLTHLLHPPTPL